MLISIPTYVPTYIYLYIYIYWYIYIIYIYIYIYILILYMYIHIDCIYIYNVYIYILYIYMFIYIYILIVYIYIWIYIYSADSMSFFYSICEICLITHVYILNTRCANWVCFPLRWDDCRAVISSAVFICSLLRFSHISCIGGWLLILFSSFFFHWFIW